MLVLGYDEVKNCITQYNTLEVFPYTYIVACYVCDDEALAVKGVFPVNWKIVKKYNFKLCPSCANKFREMHR